MVASSNSMEVGILGSEGDKWSQWILGDSARAELPLSASKQETMPVGITFDTSSVESVLWGEASLPPTPFLFLLSHHGLLCCFRVINIKAGAAAICHPPEVLLEAASDQFMDKDPFAIVPSEAPKQVGTSIFNEHLTTILVLIADKYSTTAFEAKCDYATTSSGNN